MYPEAIKDIYQRVPVGTKVTSVDQPVKVGWIDNKMYVEVSPTQEQSLRVEELGEFKSYEITKEDMKRITTKAGGLADRIDWEAVRKAVREHRGYPVAVLDSKGVKGAHVVDEMEEQLQSVAVEDKQATDKARAAQKAERAAVESERAKNDAYAADRKKKPVKTAKEVNVVTNTEPAKRTVNQ